MGNEKAWEELDEACECAFIHILHQHVSCTQISTADRTHARTGLDTQRAQVHNHTQNSNPRALHPSQTNFTFTRTHTPPDRRTMPINRRHLPASQPHSLSHPHARAHSPGEPSPTRKRWYTASTRHSCSHTASTSKGSKEDSRHAHHRSHLANVHKDKSGSHKLAEIHRDFNQARSLPKRDAGKHQRNADTCRRRAVKITIHTRRKNCVSIQLTLSPQRIEKRGREGLDGRV